MRTPLHAIRAFTQLSLGRIADIDDPKLARHLGSIDESVRRLGGFVEALLSLAKLQAGRMQVTPVPVDLHRKATAIAGNLESLLMAKRLRVGLHDTTTDLRFRADEKMVEQVLTNLLSNAIKSSPEGGSITFEQTHDEQCSDAGIAVPAVRLTVGDEGVGVPEDELETIFETFEQSFRTKSGAGGTGLGLSICREIMRCHGGTITAHNRASGSVGFHAVIPREAVSHAGTAESLS